MDNSALMDEMKNALKFMCKNVVINKISLNEFITWYKLLIRYISLGTKDYFAYAESLNGACVMINDSESLKLFNYCKNELAKIIGVKQKKSIRK